MKRRYDWILQCRTGGGCITDAHTSPVSALPPAGGESIGTVEAWVSSLAVVRPRLCSQRWPGCQCPCRDGMCALIERDVSFSPQLLIASERRERAEDSPESCPGRCSHVVSQGCGHTTADVSRNILSPGALSRGSTPPQAHHPGCQLGPGRHPGLPLLMLYVSGGDPRSPCCAARVSCAGTHLHTGGPPGAQACTRTCFSCTRACSQSRKSARSAARAASA
jgi:hypothetical protein